MVVQMNERLYSGMQKDPRHRQCLQRGSMQKSQSPSSRISFWISRPAAPASWSMPRIRARFLP